MSKSQIWSVCGKMTRLPKLSIVLAMLALYMMVGPGATLAYPPPPKVDICHLEEETGLFEPLNVSSRSAAAHLAHGDCLIDDGIDCTVDSCDPQLGCVHDDDACTPKLVFTTSTGYTGDLMTEGGGASGLEGADNICNMHAANAGLPGTYTAWVSADGPGGGGTAINAKDRVTQATVPYHVPAAGGGVGAKVADDFADILTCEGVFPAICLDSAINRDENGNSISTRAWTGTRENGNLFGLGSSSACENWTNGTGDGSGCPTAGAVGRGRVGNSVRINSLWTSDKFCSCDFELSLYCFQD